MTTDDFLAQLKKAMAGWIESDPASILFVDEKDLRYDSPRKASVNRGALFSPQSTRLREFTEGSHSWVHANLHMTADNVQVVSLRHAAQGTLRKDAQVPFSLNASRDPTPLELVDEH